ncbi:CPBP family intramembrane metalloprotease [Muricauda ruestringensis]|uniref:CPBP family glutamic-type intramembrane protease n=1 Tax=Flagellimonas ruestringensis TaxID=111501 RepID=UPI001CD5CA55|nr:CPBP family glutamic-type intramembrane protease [Allomuricauda ruestringensis]MCA0959654.1 CPBP family intramembrane metalloprotease [Allomuricauda ruestringensis]
MSGKPIKNPEKKYPYGIPLFWLLFLSLISYKSLLSYLVTIFNPLAFEIGFTNDISLFEVFILSIVLGPLFETFIFHFVLILLLKKAKLTNPAIIFISAIIFALFHSYNLIYILAVIIPGLIYAWYFIELEKRNRIVAFCFVFLLHASSNLYAFMVDDLLGWF